ncbi:MAG: virulence RhuM family protein [Rubrivivax sp.]|nr:virulence RhuM family protein [Rubrivivax sp.]
MSRGGAQRPPQAPEHFGGVNKMVATEFLLYETEDGHTRIDVRMVGETVWLSLKQITELFGRDKSVISRHLKNLFDEGELVPESVVADLATTAADGKTYQVTHYNLDVIISVGYRVKSLRGTQFRIWATQRLREYLVKGFAMDDERLKEGGNSLYFKELLARIRDIRSSEKVFWQQVLEIYSTSIDYSPRADESQRFFATVQNKMHWAAHGHTAAEVIARRADAGQPHMGLTTWKGTRPRLRDVEVAKNYLSADELDVLNRLTSMYLDFAELQARRRRPMSMVDWIRKLDEFLTTSEYDVLQHAGKVSNDAAVQKARDEYGKYQQSLPDEPSPVERHFAEAVSQVKTLSASRKKRGFR